MIYLEDHIPEIKNLVMNAIEGVDYDKITVTLFKVIVAPKDAITGQSAASSPKISNDMMRILVTANASLAVLLAVVLVLVIMRLIAGKRRLQLVSLKDRVARLMGMTNSEEEWNTIVDNIRHDIPRLASVESDVVYADVMAAKLREALAKTGFHDVRVEILPGELQFVGYAPKESSQTFVKLVEEAVKYFPENARLSNLVKWKDSEMTVEGEKPVPKARQLPITGIVVHPYSSS